MSQTKRRLSGLSALALLIALGSSQVAAGVTASVRVGDNESVRDGVGFTSIGASHVGGPLFASANSITGQLKVSGFSDPLSGAGFSSYARISEEIIFDVIRVGPATITLNGHLAGSIATGGGNASGVLTVGTLSESGTAQGSALVLGNILACDLDERVVCVEGSMIDRAVSYALELPTGRSFVNLIVALSGSASWGGSYDFANTAHIWIDIPEGVTMTPTTAGFLAQAIPEPATCALLLAGLALLLVRRRSLLSQSPSSAPQVFASRAITVAPCSFISAD